MWYLSEQHDDLMHIYFVEEFPPFELTDKSITSHV